jgi:broad specificity phosphatase PhoE
VYHPFGTNTISSYVSPRKRAQRTFELLNLGLKDPLPWKRHGDVESEGLPCQAKVEVTEDIREWDYGDYEGITTVEIRKIRDEQGYKGTWDIWKDGCPGGESVYRPYAYYPRPKASTFSRLGKLTCF